MSKLIPDFPAAFVFSTLLPVRVTDLNYGGHVGNDRVLSLIHEARMQYLAKLQLSELRFGETGLILKQASIDFVKEMFWGDQLRVSVTAGEFSRVAFALFYKIEIVTGSETSVAALAKTMMICYDYEHKKLSLLKDDIKQKLI